MEEHIQRTGVAIETQGFTFITSGKKRESLTVRKFQLRPNIKKISWLASFLLNVHGLAGSFYFYFSLFFLFDILSLSK